jgi:hypothetical protein
MASKIEWTEIKWVKAGNDYHSVGLEAFQSFAILPVGTSRRSFVLRDHDDTSCFIGTLRDCKSFATTLLKAKQKTNGVHKLNDIFKMTEDEKLSNGSVHKQIHQALCTKVFSFDKHLDNLIRHITLVREACTVLGKRFISQGRKDLGRLLIARGFVHDASKFSGIEWDYLHAGPDVPQHELDLAVKQHVRTNAHHPEYHGGIDNMSPLDAAEMVCDWYARSHEFGTDLRQWIKESAVDRFNIDLKSEQFQWINECVDQLLQDPFKRS